MTGRIWKVGVVLALAVIVFVPGCCQCCKKKCAGKPDLVAVSSGFDGSARTVSATVKNIGLAAAGPFMVYIEVNRVGAPASAKPEAQFSDRVAGLGVGQERTYPAIALSAFSARPTIDLNTISSLNLVVRVDAKVEVDECNEANNVLDRDFN